MVGAAVHAVYDGVGRTSEFVMQAPLHQPAYERRRLRIQMEFQIPAAVHPAAGQRPVHGLGDVIARG